MVADSAASGVRVSDKQKREKEKLRFSISHFICSAAIRLNNITG
jgi:hypothetical protein